MKYTAKRFFSILLTLMLVLNMVPVSAISDGTTVVPEGSRSILVGTTPQGSNVFVEMEYHLATAQTELANYYVVVGPFGGFQAQSVGAMTQGENGFCVDSEKLNDYFVVLKQADSQSIAEDQNGGSTEFYFSVNSGDSESNGTKQIADGRYTVNWSKNTTSDHHYKMVFTENVRAKAQITLAGDISTDDMYVVFRQPMNNSVNKAYCIKKVTGDGEYICDSTLVNPEWGDKPYDYVAATEVLIVKANNPGTDLTNRNECSWMFQSSNFDSNNGLTVYHNGALYPDNSTSNTVTIAADATDTNKTNITIGSATYTARLDLYDAWNVKHTETVIFTSGTEVTASNGTDSYSDTIAENGAFLAGYQLPSTLNSWTFSNLNLDGYILNPNPTKIGTEYVFEAHKPDTYTVAVRYMKAWGEEEADAQDVHFDMSGTITMTGADNQTYTGTIQTDGTVTMDPVPAAASWQINGNNRIGDFTFKPSTTAGQENPSLDTTTHTYTLTLRKARTHRVEIEYYDSWGRGKITEAVPVGDGYTIEAKDADGHVYTGTIDAATGAVNFGQKIPEIAEWTVKHNGTVEDPQQIGSFKTDFGPENPDEQARYDSQINNVAGYYIIAANKPNTYSAQLSFYTAEGDAPLENVTLPETYVIKARATDGTVITGTVAEDGTLEWPDEYAVLPKISEFTFFKANGTDPVTRYGDYVLSVVSYEDTDLYATYGAYQIIARAPKLYPSKLEYLPANTTALSAHYYLVASVEGEKVAYAAIPDTTNYLTFIPFGNANGRIRMNLTRAEAGSASTAQGIELPEDASFILVKSDSELSPTDIYNAAAAPALLNDYTLELVPDIEKTSPDAGITEEDTLVFKAQKMWTGNEFHITTYDYDAATPIRPDVPFGDNYYLRVRIRDQVSNQVIGWNLIPINDWKKSQEEGQADTSVITVSRFTQLGQRPLDLADNSDAWVTFQADKHYIEVDSEEYPARIVKITDRNQLDWDKATNPTFVQDDPPTDFKYKTGEQKDGYYQIKLAKAKPVDYYVRLKFNTTNPSEINLDGSLYVKVTIKHQSGQDTYGWEKIDNANFKKSPYMTVDTTNGCTYIDVPVSQWKDGQGNIIDGEKYKGTEKEVKVELVGAVTMYGNVPTPSQSSPMSIGSYVNNARVDAYPTGTENVDHFEKDNDTDPSNPRTTVRDVVTLTMEPDQFDGYSLDYILNGYNIVTLCPNTTASPSNSGESAFGDGDFLMKNHCMGGVLVRGDIIHISGTGVADSEYITKPSVIGGYVPANAQPFINNRENNNNTWNGYVGSVNTVVGETVNGVTSSGSPSKPRPDGSVRGYTGSAGHTAAYGDTYVDWDKLQSTILDTSEKLAEGRREITAVRLDNGEYKVDVTLGDNVIVKYPDGVDTATAILNVNIQAPEGLDPQASSNIPSTIVNLTGTGTYIPPKVTVNNESLTTKEDGKGMSLVWNYPNAAQVNLTASVTPFFGHVVAPKAYVNVEGGNYSGCMVGNKVSSAGEGHLYPYNGGKLIQTDIGFQASKTVDEMTPEQDQLFYFELDELDQDGSVAGKPGQWIAKETVKNETGSVKFSEIEYGDPGVYYYKISEYPSSVYSDIKLDTTEYIVKTVIISQIDGTNNKLVVESETYYRVPENVTDYVESYTEEGVTKYRIKDDVLENLNVPSGANGEEIAAAYLTFNNESKDNTSVTVKKTLTGEKLTNGQFSFRIERISPSGTETETENGTVIETELKGTDPTAPVTNTAEGLVSFGKLKFTLKEGKNSETWTYKIWEVVPNSTDSNYIYDQSEYNLIYTVTRDKNNNTVNVAKTIQRVKNADGSIPAPAVTVQDIIFANTRKTGELEISKTVVSPIPAEETQKFSFTVELKMNDQPLAGTFGGYTFNAEGKATIEVAGGASVSITGIPTGATYTVTEATYENFTTTVGTGTTNVAAGTISETKSTAGFTNTRKTGSISISKTVVSPIPAEATKAFKFSIQLSDTTITGIFTGTIPNGTETPITRDIVFTNGVATDIEVCGGQTLTIAGLPMGITYTVTEATDTDFDMSHPEGDTGSGTVSDTVSETSFINTRKLGDLEVSKTVKGTSDKTKVFHFTVTVMNGTAPVVGKHEVDVTATGDQLTQFTLENEKRYVTFDNEGKASFTLKADEKVLIKGLPQGVTYKVDEDTSAANMPSGYEQTAPAGGEAAGTISGELSKAGMENTYTLQTTSINFGGMKYIQGTDSTDKVFTFELYETDNTYSTEGKTPVEKKTSGTIGTAGQTYSFSTITYDTKDKDYYYVVKEQAFSDNDKEGWTTDTTVYRIHVHTNDDGQGQLFTTVQVYDKDGNLITGKTEGQLDFVNTYEATGKVTFQAKKNFTNGNLSSHPIKIRLSQVDGDRSENAPVSNKVLEEPITVELNADGNTQTVAFNTDGDQIAAFVKKQNGNVLQDDTQNTYWFLIQEEDDNRSTAIDYDPAPKRWIKVTLADDGKGHLLVTKTPGTTTAAVDANGNDAVFVNEQLGSVQATKVFNLNGAVIPVGFQIKAEYTVDGQEHVAILKTAAADGVVGPDNNTCDGTAEHPYIWTIENLPIGTIVTFTESGMTVDGYSMTSTFQKGTSEAASATAGTLEAAVTAPVGAFVNTYTRDTGSLKLKKTVTVNGEGTETDLVDGTYTFTIQGTDEATRTLTPRVITIEFEHGSVKTIKEGDKTYTADVDGYATITGLPTGTYSVTETLPVDAADKGIRIAEQPASDIAVEKDGPDVEIKTAAFRNNRDVGSLEISKAVTGTTDKTKEFKFEVTLTVPTGGVPLAGTYDAVLTTGKGTDAVTEAKTVTVGTNGQVTIGDQDITLKADQSLLIKNLPAGTTYTVSEKTPLPDGYQKDSPAGSHTGAVSSTPSRAPFVNNYTLETTSVAFGGLKMIEGVDSTEKEFYFELYETGADYATSAEKLKQTVHTSGTIQKTAGKTYGFTAITYNNVTDKINGDNYYYVIKEKAFIAGQESGWTISDLEYHVHVNVTDNGAGVLNRTVELFDKNGNRIQGDDIGALNFTNTYHATGSTNLKAQKVFTNGKLTDKKFTIKVTQVVSAADDAAKVTGTDLKLTTNPTTASTTSNANNSEIVTLVDTISFSEADIGKTFYFRIEEDTSGLNLVNGIAGGVQYDTSSKLVTITVGDNKDGSLSLTQVPARAGGTDFDVSFTNEQLGSIQLTKKVLNTANQPITTTNKYTFTITGTGVSETVEVDANNTTPVVVSNLPLNTELTITETGCPNITGYKYDGTTLKVDSETPVSDTTVSVTITNTDTKTVAVEAVNTYERKTGTAEIQATKSYNNWGDGKQFTFTLTKGNNDAGVDTPMPGNSATVIITLPNATGNPHLAAFGTITYDTAGTYNYTIQETGTVSGNGVTYDTNTYAVQVVVTEGDTGLTTAVTYGTKEHPGTPSADNLTIINTYTAAGHKSFSGTKTLNGREFKSGDVFTFTITPQNGAPLRISADGETQSSVTVYSETKTSGHTAGINYGPFYYKLSDLDGANSKTFKYTVSEVKPAVERGIVYDTEAKTLSITVTDQGNGTLKVELTDGTSEPNFTNTYSATGNTDLKVKKVFTNGKLTTDKVFTFKVTQVVSADDDTIVIGENLKLSQNPTTARTIGNANAQETVSLVDSIAFDQNDNGKTFYFRVSEDLTNPYADVRYDDAASSGKLITVTVTDPQDGSPLVITKSSGSAGTDFDVTFTNEQLGSIKLKKLVVDTGDHPISTANGTYVFSITGNGESRTANVPANETDYVTVENLPLGTYTITETSSPDVDGYNYKSTEIKVGNTATPGKTATVTITNDQTKTVEVVATNTYQVKSGDAEIRVTKDYNKWGDGKTFTFTLTAQNDDKGILSPMPAGVTGASMTGTASIDQKIVDFGTINYTADGTYNYTIQETGTGTNDGITYDTTVYHVQVVVSQESSTSGLQSTVTYGTKEHPQTPSANSLTVTNTYDASGHESFSGTKTLNGREFKSGDRFEFTITPDNGAPLRRSADGETQSSVPVYTEAKTSGNEAGIDYGLFYYKLSDLGGADSKTFTYTVSEVEPTGDKKGISYAAPQTLSITVTDQKNGSLSVTLTANTTAPSFTNTYDAAGNASFSGTKTLNGREFKNGETFGFTIEPIDGAPLRRSADGDKETSVPANTTAVTGGHTATIEYGSFYYKLSDLEGATTKTFRYKVSEVVPADKKGITYAAAQTLEIKVTDNCNGTLSVALPQGTTAPDFTNSYEAKGTVTFRGKKTFTNGNLKDHPFSIRITQVDAKDSPVQATTNVVLAAPVKKVLNADASTANAVLSTITFVKNSQRNDVAEANGTPKEYWFMIEELDENDDKSGIRNDPVSRYWVKVTLEDNGEGVLTATKSPNNTPDASFVNEQLGGIRVSKAFTGDTVNVKDSFVITASYLQGGQTVMKTLKINASGEELAPLSGGEGTTDKPYIWEIKYLPVGTDVTFTESGMTVEGYSVETTFSGNTVTDPAGTARTTKDIPTCAFVNKYTRDEGILKLSKTVKINGSTTIADTSLVDGTYSFTISGVDGTLTDGISRTISVTVSGGQMTAAAEGENSLTIKDGYVEITGLPTGLYNVTEDESGLAARFLELLSKPDGTLEVVKDATGAIIPTAEFVNGRNIGDLVISKEVSGTSDNTVSFTFRITLSQKDGTALNGTFPIEASAAVKTANGLTDTITISNGTATVFLKKDESIKIKNLPAGTRYSVEELDIPSGYGKIQPAGAAADAIAQGDTKEAAFINQYSLGSTSLTFGGKKLIEGTESTTRVFKFYLYKTGSDYDITGKTPVEARTVSPLSSGQSYSFAPISYTKADKDKDFYYVIKEEQLVQTETGWQTATTVYKEKVHVSDNGSGQLQTTVTGDKTDPTDLNFTNTYSASGTVTFQAKKNFTNGNLKNHPIRIILSQVNGDGSETAPASGKVLETPVTITLNADSDTQTVIFNENGNEISAFVKNTSRDDTANTYWFMIREEDPASGSDVVMDASAKRWIKVTLTDDGNGHLVATKTPGASTAAADADGNDAAFINEQLGSVRVAKVFDLNGATIPAGFQITAKYTVNGQEQTRILKTAAGSGVIGPDNNNCDGSAEHPYIWTISQLPVGTAVTFTESGMTVSGYAVTSTFTVTGATEPSGTVSGTLAAAVTVPEGTFVNTYTRDTGALRILKKATVNGDGNKAVETKLIDGNYAFTVTGPVSTPKSVVITITDGVVSAVSGDGSMVTENGVTYAELTGLPTGDYTVTENLTDAQKAAGISLTQQPSTALKVEKDNTSNIPVAPFTNNREIGELKISKSVLRTSNRSKEFTFTIELKKGTDPVSGEFPAVFRRNSGTQTTTVTFGTDGKCTVMLHADEYVLISKLPGGTVYTVTETATDGGYSQTQPANGQPYTGTIGRTTSEAAFVNTYNLKGTTLTFGGKKSIAVADSTTQKFRFELYETSGTAPDPFAVGDDQQPLETAETDGTIKAGDANAQAFSFGTITYEVPASRGNTTPTTTFSETHYYVVKEAVLNENGWTQAETIYKRKVVVKDGEQGTLVKEIYDEDDQLIPLTRSGSTGYDFTNNYSATGSVSFQVKKVFTNGNLKKHPFQITLKQVDGDGSETPPASNIVLASPIEVTLDADAGEQTVAFNGNGSQISAFVKNVSQDDTPNTYWFMIKETDLNPGTDVVMDPVVKRWIKITLTDDGMGHLEVTKTPGTGTPAADTYGNDAVFTNEQLGSVLVSKAFVGHDVPDNFAITAKYSVNGTTYTKTLKTTAGTNVIAPKSGDGSAGNPYIWEIKDLPIHTMVTFTEGGMTVDDYAVSASFNGTASLTGGALTAAFDPPTGTFVNTYTRDTGRLQIKKNVTVNGHDDVYSAVDGKYSFTVQSDAGVEPQTTKHLVIEIREGKVYAVTGDGTKDGEYAVVDGLPTGSYTVTEDESSLPADIRLTKEPTSSITVSKNSGGVIPTAEFTNDRTINVKVQKTDVTTGEELDGATIQILDEDENLIAEWVSVKGQPHEVTGLEIGRTYILHETVAPPGYTITADTHFIIGPDGKATSSDTTIREDGVLLVEDDVMRTCAIIRKYWNDDGNRDGLRPVSLKAELLADGTKTGLYAVLSAENNWMYQIKDLPMMKDGKEIAYTWTEPFVEGYELTGTVKTGTLTVLTNTHIPAETEISVKKVWVDDGTHPESIEVQLFADGLAVGETVVLSAENSWQYTWTGLCRYANPTGSATGSREIVYKVAETEIPEGYEAKITGSAAAGFVITNTKQSGRMVIEKAFDVGEMDHEEPDEETTDFDVIKIWEDDGNRDGNRPKSITVHLYAGGEEIKTAVLNEANGWKRHFGGLPKFRDGHPIHYSITEDPVEWYVTEIHGFTIRNRYVPETTSVVVRKVWNDEGSEASRPLRVVMRLSNGMRVVLNEQNGWMASISGLPTRINGEPAVYTWTEESVMGYQVESIVTDGNVTTVTNKPANPETELGGPGKKTGTPEEFLTIGDYDTALGLDAIINHVGDCFD